MAKNNDLVYNQFYQPHLNGGRKNNPANNLQMVTQSMYERVLTELCMNRFEWSGLPDSVNPRFLELTLTYRALSVFYRDEDAGQFFAVQGSGAGPTNFMDEPISFTVIGPGIGAGHAKTLSALATYDTVDGPRKEAECVPIWANYLRATDFDIIQLYARKLARLDRTIDITTDNMRKTKIVAANESERLSAVNALKQIADGQEAILVTDGGAAMVSNMQVLDLGVDAATLPNLMIADSKLWNKCMGLLGINNANQDKKERLVAAEVGANDEQVQATRNIALNARQQACEQINRLWPELNISVDFKQALPEPTDAPGTEFVGGSTSHDNQGQENQ